MSREAKTARRPSKAERSSSAGDEGKDIAQTQTAPQHLPCGLRASKAIFAVTGYLFEYERHLQRALTENAFESVLVYTSMSEKAHSVAAVCGMYSALKASCGTLAAPFPS